MIPIKLLHTQKLHESNSLLHLVHQHQMNEFTIALKPVLEKISKSSTYTHIDTNNHYTIHASPAEDGGTEYHITIDNLTTGASHSILVSSSHEWYKDIADVVNEITDFDTSLKGLLDSLIYASVTADGIVISNVSDTEAEIIFTADDYKYDELTELISHETGTTILFEESTLDVFNDAWRNKLLKQILDEPVFPITDTQHLSDLSYLTGIPTDKLSSDNATIQLYHQDLALLLLLVAHLSVNQDPSIEIPLELQQSMQAIEDSLECIEEEQRETLRSQLQEFSAEVLDTVSLDHSKLLELDELQSTTIAEQEYENRQNFHELVQDDLSDELQALQDELQDIAAQVQDIVGYKEYRLLDNSTLTHKDISVHVAEDIREETSSTSVDKHYKMAVSFKDSATSEKVFLLLYRDGVEVWVDGINLATEYAMEGELLVGNIFGADGSSYTAWIQKAISGTKNVIADIHSDNDSESKLSESLTNNLFTLMSELQYIAHEDGGHYNLRTQNPRVGQPQRRVELQELRNDAPTCSICLRDIEDINAYTVATLACTHSFHANCIDKWLQRNNNICPNCRGNIAQGDIDMIHDLLLRARLVAQGFSPEAAAQRIAAQRAAAAVAQMTERVENGVAASLIWLLVQYVPGRLIAWVNDPVIFAKYTRTEVPALIFKMTVPADISRITPLISVDVDKYFAYDRPDIQYFCTLDDAKKSTSRLDREVGKWAAGNWEQRLVFDSTPKQECKRFPEQISSDGKTVEIYAGIYVTQSKFDAAKADPNSIISLNGILHNVLSFNDTDLSENKLLVHWESFINFAYNSPYIDEVRLRQLDDSSVTDKYHNYSYTSMRSMFHGAISFNQDISKWDTSNVNNMSFMFYNAESFNQVYKWMGYI